MKTGPDCSPRPLAVSPAELRPPDADLRSALSGRISTFLLQALRVPSAPKVTQMVQAMGSCQLEPEHRGIEPGDFDVFTLPGKYRFVDRFHASPSVPLGEVEAWLEAMLPADSSPENHLWHVIATNSLAFCVSRRMFVQNWDALCATCREAAEVYPPDGSWILVWEQDYRNFILYRRNPDR